jgi:hypothetical protein
MFRNAQIVILVFGAFCFGGCEAQDESELIWEHIKIGDLAPSSSSKGFVNKATSKVINFDAYVIEIPAENIDKLNRVWRMLVIDQLIFNDYDAFIANSFKAGLGRMDAWRNVDGVLKMLGSRKVLTISIALADGQSENLNVVGLGHKKTISFISSGVSLNTAVIGPGVMALRIKAAGISGVSDVCKFVAYPVFIVPLKTPIPELANRTREREFAFSSTAFGLKMNVGDFVLLGPTGYSDDNSTLKGLFFCKPEGSLFPAGINGEISKIKPAVRLFVLICTGIID